MPTELYYVRARSKPHTYYAVMLSPSGWTCECTGFKYRGRCWHLDAVCMGMVKPARPKRDPRAVLAESLYS